MRPSRQPRAFATATAVAMFGLVAVAVGVIATTFAYQASRTRDVDIAAQQRQLIKAGMAIAHQQLSDGHTRDAAALPLPSSLTDAHVSLTWKTIDAGKIESILIVTYRQQRIREETTWRRDGHVWHLEELASEPLTAQR
jgi:hypothetical protein